MFSFFSSTPIETVEEVVVPDFTSDAAVKYHNSNQIGR